MKILVCRTDRLGDAMLTLPACAWLRSQVPGCAITLVCRPENAALMALCPHVAEVLPWQPENGSGVLRGRLRDYAAAVMCLPKPPGLAWRLWREGIPVRAGSGRRWWSWMFTAHPASGRAGTDRHEAQLNIEVAAAAVGQLLGQPASPTPALAALSSRNLHLTPALAAEAGARLTALGLPAHGTVMLHGGSRGSAKDWPIARMEALAAELAADGIATAWTIGPADSALRTRLAARPQTKILGDMAMPVLAAVLARAGCVVANSTGPLHVAAGVGTPVVGLYPPVVNCDPQRWGPLGGNDGTSNQPRAVAITAPTLVGEPRRFLNPDACPPTVMERIELATVSAAVRRALSLKSLKITSPSAP